MSDEPKKWIKDHRYVVVVPTFEGRCLKEFTVLELGIKTAKLSRAKNDEAWFLLEGMEHWEILETFSPKRSGLFDAALADFWIKEGL